ncbi:peroxide stress protein YaaA [uncultured Algimonas sp.]|uniref:peroxide stress protein YaaA n=1 Tax=uncultured Algimonas sp. TaxID=1547920 RepID=UPI00262C27CE|nr:peroxide stress protein YaaA [uncultured Algimonas sp.]
MITLLSPAKKLNMDAYDGPVAVTRPRLLDDTKSLAATAKQKSLGDLKRLMHLSDNLAQLNADRFDRFDPDGEADGMKPAVLAFDGDVYWGLEAKSLSDDDLNYAQDHLRILSGLYGLLRPMDAIQPYRLEMGTRMANARGATLYEFWDDRIADQLRDDVDGHDDPTVLNLASNEYFKAVRAKSLGLPVLSVKFLEEKDGKARPIQYYTKFGRGLFARWVVENRIDRAEGLRDFDAGGYELSEDRSSAAELVFERPQPPKKS